MTSTDAPVDSTLDVSRLPSYAFGFRDPVWWGALMMVAIESTAIGLLLVSYFYIRGNYDVWPPSPMAPAALRLAIIEAALLFTSFLPMVLSVRAARRHQLVPARRWLMTATALGAAMLVVRAFEIPLIPFRWDSHAYGSVFWMTFGVHITHMVTGVFENAVMIAVLLLGPVEKKHFSDIEASALLWYFSVLEWVPGFAILYVEPLLRSR